MTEKPILMCGDMVRAIQAGRKTQTRRIIKPQLDCDMFLAWQEGVVKCPYAVDRLWVKETFCIFNHDNHEIWYRATPKADAKWHDAMLKQNSMKWKPSIFMPRHASRINLTVKSIHAERLQDISEEDAKAEGIEQVNYVGETGNPLWKNYNYPKRDKFTVAFASPSRSYASLWNTINGRDSWNANPWVWVIKFTKEEV